MWRKRGAKSRGSRSEMPRAGVGFLGGGGLPSPSTSAMVPLWGRAVRSPSGVRGEAPAAKRFYHILSTQDGLSRHVRGVFVTDDKTECHKQTVDCCRNCFYFGPVPLSDSVQHCTSQNSSQIGSIATGSGDIFFRQKMPGLK